MELHLHCGIADLLPRQMLSCLNSEQVKFVKSWTDRLTDSQPGGPDWWLGYSVLSTGHLYSSSFARLTGDQPSVKISQGIFLEILEDKFLSGTTIKG